MPRISTYGQTLDAQLEQLGGAGCTKIFREKVTGAHSNRRQLLKLLGHPRAGPRGDGHTHWPRFRRRQVGRVPARIEAVRASHF